MSSSLAVLLEVKTTHSSAVLSLHLSQCFTPPLKSIPASFFPHAPCPPSWIPSLPAILTPVLRMCHLFKTTYATLGACLSTDPIWWGNFLRRGKPLKGGRTLGAWVRSLAGLLRLISCPTTVSSGRSHNHYYRSTTSLGPAAWFGNFLPLVRFAPLGPCPVLGNFFKQILVIFVGRNTSTVATTHTATRNHQQWCSASQSSGASNPSHQRLSWLVHILHLSHNAPLAPLAVSPLSFNLGVSHS